MTLKDGHGEGFFVVDGTSEPIAVDWVVHTELTETSYGPNFNPDEAFTAETRGGVITSSHQRIFIDPRIQLDMIRLDGATGVLTGVKESEIRGRLVHRGDRLILDPAR